MALRVASGFRTVSRDAAHIVSGIISIEILAEEEGISAPNPKVVRCR